MRITLEISYPHRNAREEHSRRREQCLYHLRNGQGSMCGNSKSRKEPEG